MSCIELAPEVAEDFDRILDHLTNHQVEDPGQRIGEIIAALEVLVQNPLIGRLVANAKRCLLYTSPSPRDRTRSRMPSSA